MTTLLDALERALAAANVTSDRPWSLYCAHDVADVLEHHTFFGGHSDEDYGPCRITTGAEFDEHAAAELVELAVNALPALIAVTRAARAFMTDDYTWDRERNGDPGPALKAALAALEAPHERPA